MFEFITFLFSFSFLKKNTTLDRCFKCKFFSRNLYLKKKYKYLYLKYWLNEIEKFKVYKEGVCVIVIHDEENYKENNKNIISHGYNKCIFCDMKEYISDTYTEIKKINYDTKK